LTLKKKKPKSSFGKEIARWELVPIRGALINDGPASGGDVINDFGQ
jgi:hypothetical protein